MASINVHDSKDWLFDYECEFLPLVGHIIVFANGEEIIAKYEVIRIEHIVLNGGKSVHDLTQLDAVDIYVKLIKKVKWKG